MDEQKIGDLAMPRIKEAEEALTERYVERLLAFLKLPAITDEPDRIRGMLVGGLSPMPRKQHDELSLLLKNYSRSKGQEVSGSTDSKNEIRTLALHSPGLTAVSESLKKTASHPIQGMLRELDQHLAKALEIATKREVLFILTRPERENRDDRKRISNHLRSIRNLRRNIAAVSAAEGKDGRPGLKELKDFVFDAARCYQDLTGKKFTMGTHTQLSKTGKEETVQTSEGGRFATIAVEYLNELMALHGFPPVYTVSNINTACKDAISQLK